MINKSILLILVSAIIAFLVFFISVKKINIDKQETVNIIPTQIVTTKASPSLKTIQSQNLKEEKLSTFEDGYYSNSVLNIKIQVDEQLKINECESKSCARFYQKSINDVKLNIDLFKLYGDDEEEIEDRIKKTDLMCSAGGVMGDIMCQNIAVEKYLNQRGISGYKVTRKIIITEMGKERKVEDYAYVFRNNSDNPDEVIILQAESHNLADLEILDISINSLEYLN